MKSFIKHTIILAGFLFFLPSKAQQLPQFTQYMYNTVSINPAYAGSRETLSIVGLHRSQWLGFGGGPTTQTLSIHSPLRNEKVGLGFSLINDQLGYENFVFMYGDFSYTVNTNETTKLSFGLKGGFTAFSIDQELINAESADPVSAGLNNRWIPNVGAGLMLHAERWYLGLSAPRLFTNDHHNEEGYEALERVSYYFTGGYVFDLSETTKLKPTYMLKATNGAPLSLDLSANLLILDKWWLGAAYRFNESAGAFGAMVDYQVSDVWRIGYTYEIPTADIRPYTNGTHEILLMYEFLNKKERVKSPRFY
jgi:type IX secretion system PorP/SprF family membrane protein